MKKILLSATAAVTALSLYAEGYQVNTLSTKQIGMAHTGVAMHLGAESMYFNPAGLGFLDKTVELTGSFNAVIPHASAKIDGTTYKTAHTVATPLMVNAAFSIYDNFKAGVSFYTPYGSNIDWTENWPGSVLNQSVKLQVFSVQPTFAWRITPKLSIGGGIAVSWGSVDLNKGLVNPATLDQVIGVMNKLTGSQLQPYGNVSPASVNLKGTANVTCGFNVGAMYDITDQVTVGASFRTQMNMKVDAGTASLTYADEQARQLLSTIDVINRTDFKAEMPCPWILSFGASYKPIPALTLAADARLTGWKAYKSLDIEFLDDRCAAFNQHIEKNYHNAWAVSVGAQYAVTDRLDVRAGVMVDATPVNDNYYNPETPGMTKIEPTVGLSFRPVSSLSIDLGFMYVAGLGADDVSCTYDDLVAGVMPQLNLPLKQTIKADYRVHAFTPSIGISYSF